MCNFIDGSDILDYFTWSCHSCLEYKSANLAAIGFPIWRDLHLAVFAAVWKKSRWRYRTLAMSTLWGKLALQYILWGINTTVLKYGGTLRELWLFLILKQQFGLSLPLLYWGKHSAGGKEKERGWNEIIKNAWKRFFDTRAMNIQDVFLNTWRFLNFQTSSRTMSVGESIFFSQLSRTRRT